MNKIIYNNKRKNNNKKILILSFILTILLVFAFFYINYSSNASIVSKAKGTYKKDINDPELQKITVTILGYIQGIGIAIFLGSIMVFGISWVSASADKKAEIKEKAILWIVAGVLIFSATKIVEIIVNVGNKIVQ